MYEKVWSGDVDGYEIFSIFIEHRGLFRYTAKKDGVLISDRLCADPMDAGLMDGPGIMSNFTTPFVPSTSKSDSRAVFAPFHTPEEIVGGTLALPPPTGRKTANGRRSRR